MSDHDELRDVRAILRELRIRYDQLEKRASDAEARHLECSKQLKVEMEHHAWTRLESARWQSAAMAIVKCKGCPDCGSPECGGFYRPKKNGGAESEGEPTTKQGVSDVPF